VRWQCRHCAYFAQAALSLQLGAEATAGALDGEHFAGCAMPHAEHLAQVRFAHKLPGRLKVLVVLEQARVHG
jgi:hypothetical protein